MAVGMHAARAAALVNLGLHTATSGASDLAP